ncbi:MAG: 3'-5' exonuclease [Terracidiphilus sp.]
MNVDAEQYQRTLYLDLELTCWDRPQPVGRSPEIIEIGVVEMDLKGPKIINEAAYLVWPRHLEISTRCANLTGLSVDDLKSAPPFEEVIDALVSKFSPSTKLCCTWGRDAELEADACRSHGVRTLLRNALDMGYLFSRVFLLCEQPSLRKAVDIIGLLFDGVPHTALGDARNTAHVHAAIIRRMRREPDPAHDVRNQLPDCSRPTLFAEKLNQAMRKLNGGCEPERG